MTEYSPTKKEKKKIKILNIQITEPLNRHISVHYLDAQYHGMGHLNTGTAGI